MNIVFFESDELSTSILLLPAYRSALLERYIISRDPAAYASLSTQLVAGQMLCAIG